MQDDNSPIVSDAKFVYASSVLLGSVLVCIGIAMLACLLKLFS